MKIKALNSFLIITLSEGLLALAWALTIPAPLNRARTVPHATIQGIAAGLLGMLILLGLVGWLFLRRDPKRAAHWRAALDEWLTTGERVIILKDFILITLGFALEGILLTFLSVPAALLPVLVYLALLCAQAWLLLRHAYPAQLQTRCGRLAETWHALEPVQRQTIKALALITGLYFSVFALINWQGISVSAETFFAGTGDEVVIYPVAYEMVSPAPDVAGQVYRFLIHEDYHYGYPFFYANAIVLAGSRFIFGDDFINQTRVNLFILRQFVSILPMLLAVLILVYCVTKFKSTGHAVLMLTMMLLMPGLVRYNQQYWHPDGLMLLCVALTFYYLQRDRLSFGRDFYYAAVMCGLAAATKLYGFFFFLAIAGYLLAGWLKKYLTFKTVILSGLGFIAVMGIAILYSSPYLWVPSAQQTMVTIMSDKTAEMSAGYPEPDPQGVYTPGLSNWLKYFEYYYGKPYFFFFTLAALVFASAFAQDRTLYQLLLAWNVVVAVYLIYFITVKPFHYMLPLAVPLYAGALAVPPLLRASSQRLAGLPQVAQSLLYWSAWGFTWMVLGSQLIFNLWDIFTSPYIRVYF